MNAGAISRKKQPGYIKNSTLILWAFATAFFPRVLTALHVPAAINFLHFATVPIACGVALFTSRAKRRRQISVSKSILVCLLVLLAITVASAWLNSTGLINVVLDFLLLTEPFIFLLTIVSISLSPARIEQFRTWILRFALSNLFLAYVQKYAWHLELFEGEEDNIKGVFIGGGAGHVVGGSVSVTLGVYYLITAKTKPLWLRVILLLATFNHVIISDTKQVFLAFLVALMLLVCTKLNNVVKALQYLTATAMVVGLLIFAANTVEPALLTWARPDITDEFIKLKSAGFRIIPTYYHSSLNWWLGLGPGHTIGRLGGWMLGNYWNLLGPLGATQSPASSAVWKAVGESWLGDKSSMFSPLFGWAGIWGDLGFLGLGAYFCLSFVVWRQLAVDDLSKYFLLTVFVFGCIFSQLEEPGYMLFVACLIGLQWHEHQTKGNATSSNEVKFSQLTHLPTSLLVRD